MRKILILTLVIMANSAFAQTISVKKPIERKGFIVGLGVGTGLLNINTNDTDNVAFSITLPNIKIGYMLNNQFALLGQFQGVTYKYKGKDRGFEALIIAGQYWIKENWWVLGGTGLTFDAPAFYTVKKIKKTEFYTGIPALSFATGYEVWHKGSFSLDLQYRLFLGKSNLPDNGQRKGVSSMFIIGFNWY